MSPATTPGRKRGYKAVDSIEVSLFGRPMGVVALDPAYGYYAFAYLPEFLRSGIEPAPLTMPLNDGEPYLFTDLPEATYHRLPALLGDALPDDFGNALIDRYMAEQGVERSRITALDRLAYMGQRAMGALSFKPARGPQQRSSTAIEMGALVEQARAAVSGRIETDDYTNAALRSIIEVGTSAGGARAKAVIAWNPRTREIRSGQVDVAAGFEHWLLKFDGLGADRELGLAQNFGRIEHAYHRMARTAGIDMAECHLLEENGRAHFMTRRFDRAAGGVRHHIQTLCAMDHIDFRKKAANAYEQLFITMQRLHLPYEQLEEAYRRMVFNVMARNCDDHSKNFAFRLREGAAWELAPAYDLTFAHNPQGEWTHQHLMSVNGRFRGFVEADFLAVADRFAIGTAHSVIAEVRAAVLDWPRFAAASGVPERQAAEIGALHLPAPG